MTASARRIVGEPARGGAAPPLVVDQSSRKSLRRGRRQDRPVIADLSLHARPGRDRQHRRAVGLRQDHAAQRALRPDAARAPARSPGTAATVARHAAAASATCCRRTCCCPWRTALAQRHARPRDPSVSARRAHRAGAPAARPARPPRLRTTTIRRRLSGGMRQRVALRAHAGQRAGGAAARRAVRGARFPDQAGDRERHGPAGAQPAPLAAADHPRYRGGGLALRPGHRAHATGPTRIRAIYDIELDVDRTDMMAARDSPHFTDYVRSHLERSRGRAAHDARSATMRPSRRSRPVTAGRPTPRRGAGARRMRGTALVLLCQMLVLDRLSRLLGVRHRRSRTQTPSCSARPAPSAASSSRCGRTAACSRDTWVTGLETLLGFARRQSARHRDRPVAVVFALRLAGGPALHRRARLDPDHRAGADLHHLVRHRARLEGRDVDAVGGGRGAGHRPTRAP